MKNSSLGICVVFLLAFRVNIAFCQETNLSEVIIGVAEELAADESDSEAISTYIEKLHELAEDPVMINSGDEEEISRLFFLSGFQVNELTGYVRKAGEIVTAFEIMNIPGFDREIAAMMIPFITLQKAQGSVNGKGKIRNTLLTSMFYKKEASENTTPGSPLKILSRYSFSSGSFSGGITAEKDAGEKLFSGQPPRPDFLSYGLGYKGNGFIRKIIIGDFSVRLGQGTCINTSVRTGTSLTAQGNLLSRNEIRQYTSTNENNFYRGIAAEFSLRKLALTVFCSKNLIDASVSPAGDSAKVQSFFISGLHDSNSVLMKKDAVAVQSYGVNLNLNLENARAGFTLTQDMLSIPVSEKQGSPGDLYDFAGDRTSLYSFYYNWRVSRMLLFGELSFNPQIKHALVQGVSFRFSDRLSATYLFREYEPGYISLHGSGPGSTVQSARCLSGSFTFEAARHLFVSAGCEVRHFPWLKYMCSSPSYGLTGEVRLKYLPSDNTSIEALFNERLSTADDQEVGGIPNLNETRTYSGRCSFRYSPANNFTLITRVDFKTVDPSGDNGMMMMQNATFSFRKIPLTFWIRYCLFSTAGWDSRIYAYENDLLHSFSIPALSGDGSRCYLMVRWKIDDFAEIRLKYGTTSLVDRGNVEIKEDIRGQIRIRF